MNAFTRWDKVLKLLGIKTTWVWCVVGCTIGRHSWSVSLEKCRNGVPIISGGFMTVYTCSDAESAQKLCTALGEAAKKANAELGYAP